MKKKKNYFIISSFIQILLSMGSILMLDYIKQKNIDTVQVFPTVVRDRIISIYSNDLFYIIPNILSILIALIVLLIVFRKSLDSCRNSILVLSIFDFVFAPNLLVNIFSIISIIIIATIPSNKRKHEKLHIPNLNRIDIGSNYKMYAWICLAVYFSQIFIPTFDNRVLSIFVSILFYLVVLLVCLFCFKDNLKRDFCEFKKNFKAYLLFLIPRLLVMYVLYFVLSFICLFVLNNNIPINQQSLDNLPLWVLIPLACIYAPIVEEILFRGCIRRFIKNDIFFIVLSGFIFGILHTLSESSLYSIFTLMIPYAFLGSSFAYFYKKTNNIFSNILCHSFHNSLAIIIKIIFTIF